MEWKWTKGEPYERSRRIYKKRDPDDTEVFRKDFENSAYSSSLNHDENTWNILNESVAVNGFKVSNKREDLDTKMADREMIQQIGFNPFLSNTNYADDIGVRDQFLKPINTKEDRIKNERDS
jgi:predicted HTH transcriptional regulator